jgi:hypothetical protein
VSYEVIAYVAEGNCVAARRGGEQPECEWIACRNTNLIRRRVVASLLMHGEAWFRKEPIERTR